MSTVITYPTPLYSNPPINPEYYKPSRFTISDVTLGQTTIVTATEDMDYVIGQEVRLLIQPSFGCTQLNNKKGYVISLPSSDSVEIDIDSSVNVNEYIASSATTPSQILAIGDINSGIISSNGLNVGSTNIPGSFINISPQ